MLTIYVQEHVNDKSVWDKSNWWRRKDLTIFLIELQFHIIFLQIAKESHSCTTESHIAHWLSNHILYDAFEDKCNPRLEWKFCKVSKKSFKKKNCSFYATTAFQIRNKSIGYTAATLKNQELCLQLQESGQEFLLKFSMGNSTVICIPARL